MVTFVSDLEGITPSMLTGGFFEGWPNPPSAAVHLRILESSDLIGLAIDGDNVVGFVTAITDGVLSAYVPLLEVLLTARGKGIGTELVAQLLGRLDYLYMVDVACEDDLAPFYERLGFTRGTAMVRRIVARQNGVSYSSEPR